MIRNTLRIDLQVASCTLSSTCRLSWCLPRRECRHSHLVQARTAAALPGQPRQPPLPPGPSGNRGKRPRLPIESIIWRPDNTQSGSPGHSSQTGKLGGVNELHKTGYTVVILGTCCYFCSQNCSSIQAPARFERASLAEFHYKITEALLIGGEIGMRNYVLIEFATKCCKLHFVSSSLQR